jgi:hypothetical protein
VLFDVTTEAMCIGVMNGHSYSGLAMTAKAFNVGSDHYAHC